jgi:hypothetical protein
LPALQGWPFAILETQLPGVLALPVQ